MFPSEGEDYSVYFASPVRLELDRSRKDDTAVIKAFGYPREFTYVGHSTAGKIVRVKHDNATVEWTVEDDGNVITAISWRQL